MRRRRRRLDARPTSGTHFLHHRLGIKDRHEGASDCMRALKAHLGADMLPCLHQEVRCIHPELPRTERVLDGLTSYARRVRLLVEPLLNRFDNGLWLPALYTASLFAGCALLSDCAGRTGRTRIAMQRHAMLDGCETPVEPLMGPATVLIIFGSVYNVLLAEVPIRVLARSQWFGNEGLSAGFMALQNFLLLK
jgi:hypothetical protein